MSYSVHFAIDLEAIPDEARQQIERTMQQIAEVVGTLPAVSPFWISMKNSVLQIDAGGWRLGYRIDAARQEIHVIEADQIRR